MCIRDSSSDTISFPKIGISVVNIGMGSNRSIEKKNAFFFLFFMKRAFLIILLLFYSVGTLIINLIFNLLLVLDSDKLPSCEFLFKIKPFGSKQTGIIDTLYC